MRKGILRFFGALLFFVLLLSQPVLAGEANLVFIFDASGSMWGQIDGRAKIEIAKEALDLIVGDLPDGMNVGLVAYGHNRKGDCDDVETLIPLGPLNQKVFLAKVNALSPKGKTPMVRSIRMTAESIKLLEDETTILLISDGKETCDPDPCSFVAELKKMGINFVMHVVGFDVGGETETELKCMAKAGGGEYFPAKDAVKLKEALGTVIDKTVARNLVVSCYDATSAPLSVMVSVLDSSGKVVASDGGKRVSFSLLSGTYSLKVNPDTLSENKIIENVVVTADQITETKVVFAKAQVTVTMKDGSGKDIVGYVRIVDMQSGQYAEQGDHKGKTTGFTLSPGDYQVDMECSNTGKRIKSEPFALRAGENRNVSGICANARIGVLVFNGGQPITAYARIVDVPKDVYADEGDSTQGMRFFEVVPGRYKVDVECPDESRLRSMPFDLSGGGENRVKIDCQTGVIKTSLGQ